MTEQPPEHPKITPEEVAAMVAEEEGVPVEELEAEYREHVERFGPAEAEVHGVTYTVWIEDNDEEEQMMTDEQNTTQANEQEQPQADKFNWRESDVQIAQPETSVTEVQMEQEENVEAPKAVHHATLSKAQISPSHARKSAR